MNIFFAQKQEYIIKEKIGVVMLKLKEWEKDEEKIFLIKITGKLKDDNSFKFSQTWGFIILRGIEPYPAYITGKLVEEGPLIKLSSSLRPNAGLIVSFYVFFLTFICELFGIDTFLEGTKPYKLLFPLCVTLFLFALMRLCIKGFRERFEQLLNLKPFER
jgi:hypothetical protein